MLRHLKKPYKLLISVIGIIVLLGFGGNLLYVKMMHTLVSEVVQSQEVDTHMQKVQMEDGDETLVGYVRSEDFTKKKPTIIYI